MDLSVLGSVALAYAARGWPVFPLQPRDKRPHPGSHGCKDATTDAEAIREWWAEHPDDNIGIACGAPGPVVIDCDGDAGNLWLAEHVCDLPPGPRVRTGRGVHLYFAAPPGRRIKNRAHICPGLDARATGGYVVAPPSVHPSGDVYCWTDDDLTLAALPADLLALLDPPTATAQAPARDLTPYLRAALDRACGDVARAPAGMRNDALNRAAYSLAGLPGLDMGDAARSLLGAALAAGLGEQEAHRTIDSGLKAGAEHPREIPDRTRTRPASATVTATPVQDTPARAMTDLGNAERFLDYAGPDLAHCHAWSAWVAYDGVRWLRDVTGETERRIYASVRAAQVEAAADIERARERVRAAQAAGDDMGAIEAGRRVKDLERVRDHLGKSESSARLAAIERLARAQAHVGAEGWDADAYALNCVNGTLDLRTGVLRAHRREDRLTKLCPVAYDPDAQAPRWTRFLDEIMCGRAELVAFLGRLAGSWLTADVADQQLALLHGGGANGKSVFLTALSTLLGDYARVAAPNLLLERRGEAHPTELASLFRARLVVVQEPDAGRDVAESLVKQLTGGDRITCRRMREDFWEFAPTHKLVLAANALPVIRGQDPGIWRRVLAVPFDLTLEPGARDRTLAATLATELPGILAWAVRGCLEWQRVGLAPPDAVTAKSEAYREEMDLLRPFLNECCILTPSAEATSGELYDAYHGWAERAGHKPLSQTSLGRRLKLMGCQDDKGSGGRRYWRGIGLRAGASTSRNN